MNGGTRILMLRRKRLHNRILRFFALRFGALRNKTRELLEY
jgi:hypothetical protein